MLLENTGQWRPVTSKQGGLFASGLLRSCQSNLGGKFWDLAPNRPPMRPSQIPFSSRKSNPVAAVRWNHARVQSSLIWFKLIAARSGFLPWSKTCRYELVAGYKICTSKEDEQGETGGKRSTLRAST